VKPRFEELDYRPTPIGALSLRRRLDPVLGEVIEIRLGDEYLMSSAFTVAEVALARLGLAAAAHPAPDVVVGGLGLGCTAREALAHPVASLIVVEALEAVIGWHREGLLPLGPGIVADTRCRLRHGDFFALAAGAEGFDPDAPGRRFHAILVDIDHAPDFTLAPGNAAFYTPEGMTRLAAHLHPGGVFALWSNDPPDPRFLEAMGGAFPEAWAEEVTFPNPLQDREASNTIYLARTAPTAP
jgi:spermidine synthase